MNRLPKEKRDMIILIIFGTGVVLAGLWFGVINGQFKTLAAKRLKFEEAQKRVADAERLVKRADQIHEDLILVSNKLVSIEQEMASGDLFTWSLKTMESCITPHHLKVVDSSRPVESRVGLFAQFPYRAIIFSVRTSAYYHQFGTFLKEFENRYPYMRIQNLILDPSGTGSDEAEMLTAKFEVMALVKDKNP
jgi:hypothetical protein